MTLIALLTLEAGDEFNGQQYVPVLWKNGVEQVLTHGTTPGSARSVYVSGSDVYVAGYEYNGTNYIGIVWKNGVAQMLTNGTTWGSAVSIFVN